MARKIINSDIYNMRGLVDDVKKEMIPEETESTLSISQMGYIGDIETKRLQTQVIMTGELSNESFPSRAKLERNIITHAITNNIEKINATPAKMDAIIGIRQKDIDDMMENGSFVLDKECPIYIETFEFHLEYDLIIKRVTISGNEKVYTAQYDISRLNPSSDIVNPYISSPAVIVIDNETYIFINVIVSQIEHHVEYKKLTTSNIIDNKTLNFSFSNQLAYFEIHIIESDEEYYLTPIFEGAGIPEGINYYCWYQYIDKDMIRVRFDRNSYMPGLNSSVEILVKTTMGSEGNFQYRDDIYINMESSKYGYKNLSILFKSVSDSDEGKNRKTKKELQALIPKEALARGALTTIKDLNNYFGMIDSDQGRIIVQKKIDNQQERIYYAYFVLKDTNSDIVPSNTIDLKIPMEALMKTTISDSSSPRYVLRSGVCIHLMDDNKTGEIVSTPIKNLGLEWTLVDIKKDQIVDVDFSIRINSDEYPSINCRGLFDNKSSVYIESPKYKGSIYTPTDKSNPVEAFDKMIVSSGQLLKIKTEFTALEADTDIIFTDIFHKAFDYKKDMAVYYSEDDRVPIKINPIITNNEYSFTIPKAIKGKKYFLEFDIGINEYMETLVQNTIHIVNGTNEKDIITNLHGVVLSIDNNPEHILTGNILNYKISFIANDDFTLPKVSSELSRGLSYVLNSSKITIKNNKDDPGTVYIYNPTQIDLLQAAGFLYTNPYSVVINHYHLYSTFYMMCVNISPYVHFNYINQRSAIQFIATNLNWNRPFLGYKKNIYTMKMEISQSVAKDLGLIEKDDEGNITNVNAKMIALFYRDGQPYRYKNLSVDYVDDGLYTIGFKAEFEALDLLDQDNNIKVDNVGLLKQYEEEYGFFNDNTKLQIYALCKFPDVDGRYTRHDLDNYVPGLDGWTVTNVYDIVNGIDFYYNYAEIMGSRVTPYGSNISIDSETGIEYLEPEGYYVKSVPVFGYDYCKSEYLINNAVNALNDRKIYIDDAAEKCENSFGIDFKVFNTYGPSKIFYIIKDRAGGMSIEGGTREFIDRVNITMNFRLKLKTSNDSYTKNLIIKEVKDYMEDINKIDEIHIPTLITQINTNYRESIIYFEFLGFNDYGPGIQHLYKLSDLEIPIHDCPEFININNIQLIDGSNQPDINIFITEE